ncbi:MAG: NAD(+) synthase [Lachnospiraceae bacterium]|nr:NAD(+) synthase [Lachnospiraceae bacterium]
MDILKTTGFDAAKEKDRVIEWIAGWFEENGKNAKAVIGISGGKDSSITAALCKEALGKDRVVGVLMPNGVQADIADSKNIVEKLGIQSLVINIEGPYKAMLSEFEKNFDKSNMTITRDLEINLPPRLRMSVLYGVAQSFKEGGRVANTCNRSEDYIGYSTKYGDAAGDFSALAGLTVSEVKAIGRLLDIPSYLVDKTPSDGLSGMSDEEKIGFSYDTLDRYILTGVCEDQAIKEKIDRMHYLNLHKLKTIPYYLPEKG